MAYHNRGRSYDKLGQHQRAIEDYDKVIELDPNDAEAQRPGFFLP
ncbi:MAG: tetratricopeptide repeat protein [SAR202 cluster bacterium]|nr:tetratricopeptide repeat protein [SAR202 cluster bacterium]HIB13370.1 tetratricopeptide repeat protein [Dehalococcoidia bacterium]